MGGLERRGKTILGLAAAATVLVNAGAAVAYWRIDKAAAAGPPIQVSVTAISSGGQRGRPDGTSDVTVTVANQNTFAVVISGLSAAIGEVIADREHHDRGCRAAGAVVAQQTLAFPWHVPANSVDVFTLTGGVRLIGGRQGVCRGAIFTIPLRPSSVANERHVSTTMAGMRAT
jgi:hypothetical protein